MIFFLILMLSFSTVFSLMYMAVGIDVPGEDGHTGDDDFMYRFVFERFFLFSYYNSIGDIRMPEYGNWQKDESNPKCSIYQKSCSSMVVLALFLNFFQVIF